MPNVVVYAVSEIMDEIERQAATLRRHSYSRTTSFQSFALPGESVPRKQDRHFLFKAAQEGVELLDNRKFGCDILVANSRDHKEAETLWVQIDARGKFNEL